MPLAGLGYEEHKPGPWRYRAGPLVSTAVGAALVIGAFFTGNLIWEVAVGDWPAARDAAVAVSTAIAAGAAAAGLSAVGAGLTRREEERSMESLHELKALGPDGPETRARIESWAAEQWLGATVKWTREFPAGAARERFLRNPSYARERLPEEPDAGEIDLRWQDDPEGPMRKAEATIRRHQDGTLSMGGVSETGRPPTAKKAVEVVYQALQAYHKAKG